MVRVHHVPLELAHCWVEEMDLEELWDRFRLYAGVELSAAGPKPERSTSVLPGSDARNDDGRPEALNFAPDRSLPDSEKEQPGPGAGAFFAPAARAARFGEKEPGNTGSIGEVSGVVFGVAVDVGRDAKNQVCSGEQRVPGV